MAERKVLVKYYPPDFDADLLYKNKRSRDKQDNVRMMLPMSLQCITCGVYLYIGSKFNMRKETVLDEDYLGLQVFRFYLKCYACYSEITFKTDPKNHDYIVEGGGRRNYEPWRDINAAQEKMQELKTLEEQGNTMKFLENKTFDSKREMDILDALDEIRNANKRNASVTVDDLFLHFYTNKSTNLKDKDIEHIYDQIAHKVLNRNKRIEKEERDEGEEGEEREEGKKAEEGEEGKKAEEGEEGKKAEEGEEGKTQQDTQQIDHYSEAFKVFVNSNKNQDKTSNNKTRITFKKKKISDNQGEEKKQINVVSNNKLNLDYSSEDN